MNKINILKSGLLVLMMMAGSASYAQDRAAVLNQPDEGHMMTFDSYLNKVGRQNLEHLASKLNLDIAQAEIIAAKVLPDPSLDIEATYETFSLGLSYTVEFGKRKARVALAKSQCEYEELAFEQEFQELRAASAELFLNAVLQRELLDSRRSSYDYMLTLSQSDSLRFTKGEITENDARQSRLEAVSLLNDVYDQEAAYLSALVEFNRFMGNSCDTLMVPVGNWNNLTREYSIDTLLSGGLSLRKDLEAAVKSVEISSREYRLAKVERRPDVDLSLSYEKDWGHFLPQGRYATLGVSIPLPFSNINKGVLKSAQLQRKQSELMHQDMELQVRSEIMQAWYVFQAEKSKVGQYQSGVMDESRKVLEGMTYTYNRGESSILDVLIAQRTYNEVCQDYLETMKGYVSSLVDLERACGMWDIHF